MTAIYLVLQLVLIFLISHGQSHPNNEECGRMDGEDLLKRIVGGEVARPWPWMGAIFYIIPDTNPRKGFPVCGCTLISPRWVLTAAHCIINKETRYSIDIFNRVVEKDLVEVMLGQTELHKAKGSTHKIRRGYIMDDFKPGNEYDVALLELIDPVEHSETIQPVCLDFEGKFDCTPEFCPSDCWAVGWGSKKDAMGPINKVLYEVKRPMIINEQCLSEWKQISSKMQCYGSAEAEGVCSGDSGGPILCEKDGVWYQAAVISRTLVQVNEIKHMMECADQNSVDLHVKISSPEISGWIKTTMTRTGDEERKKEMSFSFDT